MAVQAHWKTLSADKQRLGKKQQRQRGEAAYPTSSSRIMDHSLLELLHYMASLPAMLLYSKEM